MKYVKLDKKKIIKMSIFDFATAIFFLNYHELTVYCKNYYALLFT